MSRSGSPSRLLSFLGITLLPAVAAAQAGSPPPSSGDATALVCCEVNGGRAAVARRICRIFKGKEQPGSACEADRRTPTAPAEVPEASAEPPPGSVCCNAGKRYFYAADRAECHEKKGRKIGLGVCRNYVRVCCQQDGLFFTKAQSCRRAEGRIVADRICEASPDTETVCCKIGSVRQAMSRRHCVKVNKGEVANEGACGRSEQRVCCETVGGVKRFTTKSRCRLDGGKIRFATDCL